MLIVPKNRLIIYVGIFYLVMQSLLQEAHYIFKDVNVRPTCVCSLYLLSSSVHVPFDTLKNKEKALPHKVKCLTITLCHRWLVTYKS